ncbi:hypothetical protein BKA70DRAFT_1562334 [Coprinopsis sp. MPI-PUGE-AT-0042]|nr:hypothetical protein BKA70DRAFT_1562334 [Coprinopsis sp. MPI-PUGE-AT-0042]
MAILDAVVHKQLPNFAFEPSEYDAEFEYDDLRESVAWTGDQTGTSFSVGQGDLALAECRHSNQVIIYHQLDDPDTSNASETASPSLDSSPASVSPIASGDELGHIEADGLDEPRFLAALPASTPDAVISPTTFSSATSSSASSIAPNSPGSTTRASRSGIIVPITAPAGNLVITEPPQAVGTSFYKIFPSGDGGSGANLITFGWNMTDVIVQPTSLTVKAACENGYTYAVGGEMGGNGTATDDRSAFTGDGIIPAAQTQVIWDVVGYQNANRETPLPEGLCTLRINDDRGFGAARRAGYLAPNDAVTFALYTGETYLPLASGWKCDVCIANAGERLQPFAFPKAILFPVITNIPDIRSLGIVTSCFHWCLR